MLEKYLVFTGRPNAGKSHIRKKITGLIARALLSMNNPDWSNTLCVRIPWCGWLNLDYRFFLLCVEACEAVGFCTHIGLRRLNPSPEGGWCFDYSRRNS